MGLQGQGFGQGGPLQAWQTLKKLRAGGYLLVPFPGAGIPYSGCLVAHPCVYHD